MALNTTKLGLSGVNALFKMYYGRDASQAELNYWSNKSDAELRPKLIPNSAAQLAKNKTTEGVQKKEVIKNPESKTFYRDPNSKDIYNASTDKRITNPDWEKNWSGKATEVASRNPNNNVEENPVVENKVEENPVVENPGNPVGSSMYESLINSDAFLTEQFKDTNIRNNFDKMSPTLQMAYLQMMKSLGKQVEAGKVINPNVEITPEKIKEFTDQAITELDPYYQEQIRNYKQDLDTSITRLTEDFNTGIRNAEDPFKKNLAAQAESEAQAGTVYGSERGVRETTNVNEQQQKIDEVSKGIKRDVEDDYTSAERKLGSDVISGIETPKLAEYNVTNQGFQNTGSRSLFSPTGGVVGSLQKEKTTAVANRASDLEESYRKQRLLNINI